MIAPRPPRPAPRNGRPARPRPSGVTIRDVARRAGVSVATVSRVLNEKGPARPETRQRVRRIANRLRYVPHGTARSLITRRTNTLGVLLPDLHGEFFSELMRGIDTAARRHGYHLLVSSSHSSLEEIEAMLRAIRGRVDALIVLSPDVSVRRLRPDLPDDLPLVLLNCGAGGAFHSITIDNYGGAFAMTRHLMSLGHRCIAFLTGPPRNVDAAERLRGYRDALRSRSGWTAGPIEITGDFHEEAGYRAADRLLAMKERPTAVFAANDSMAIGLSYAFRERQVRIPEDFALAGFDDIPTARYMTPALTSVRVSIGELGARAASCVVGALTGVPPRRIAHETLSTSLVIRASSGSRHPARSARPRLTHHA